MLNEDYIDPNASDEEDKQVAEDEDLGSLCVAGSIFRAELYQISLSAQ